MKNRYPMLIISPDLKTVEKGMLIQRTVVNYVKGREDIYDLLREQAYIKTDKILCVADLSTLHSCQSLLIRFLDTANKHRPVVAVASQDNVPSGLLARFMRIVKEFRTLQHTKEQKDILMETWKEFEQSRAEEKIRMLGEHYPPLVMPFIKMTVRKIPARNKILELMLHV